MNPSETTLSKDPGPILAKILASKYREVEELTARVPMREWRARAADAPPTRGFREALARPGRVRLIAEVKKASPSRGLIRPDFDPAAIARSYEAGGADAISVLTDGPFFQGSLEIFQAVREAIQLPILRKEFMIAPVQFYEARIAGADAVLLITTILPPGRLREFHDLALELGMDVLVETHSAEDARRAMTEVRPALLGINNRDLNDVGFRTDLEHTARLLPLVRELAGENRKQPAVVSESGIHTAADMARLREWGVSAALVGESLMRQADTAAAVRALLEGAKQEGWD